MEDRIRSRKQYIFQTTWLMSEKVRKRNEKAKQHREERQRVLSVIRRRPNASQL
jgi:hypothetical protein